MSYCRCVFTCHGDHTTKISRLRIIDKQATLGDINRSAIRLAKEANAEVGGNEAVIAGNICNTNIFEPGNEASKDKARFIFREQLEIAAEEGGRGLWIGLDCSKLFVFFVISTEMGPRCCPCPIANQSILLEDRKSINNALGLFHDVMNIIRSRN